MKLVIISLLLISLLVVAFLGFTAPITKDILLCVDDYNKFASTSLLIAQKERWSKEKICANWKEDIDTTITCYRRVKDVRGQFLDSFTWKVTKIIKPQTKELDKSGLLEVYDKNCYPI